MNEYINKIINLSKKAYDQKEIPVGAIVVKDNTIIGKGYNMRVLTNDVTSHAEVNAIREAANYIKDWRLNDCDLYVTLKPCDMCMQIIKESRIKNVFYLIDRNNDKKGYNNTNVCDIIDVENIGVIKEEYIKLLSDFFINNGMR